MYLAREGFEVDVYEKRAEPAKEGGVDNGRAYIIILIPRGKAALEELGVELPTDPHFLTLGSVRHPPSGKVSVTKEAGNVTWSRSDLAQFLINEARSRYPRQIRFHFGMSVEMIDLVYKQAYMVPASDEGSRQSRTAIAYDLLVGADGAASQMRAELESADKDFKVDISDSGREYKVYLNLPGDIEPEEFRGKDGSTLHLWTATNDPFMSFTAHRNPDDTYSGTFSMRTGDHANVRSPSHYEHLLTTRFAGIPPAWVPAIAEQVWTRQPSSAGKRVRCSRLSAPSVVLLGDAAHAVTPVFGQGANSSLESAKVLGHALRAAAGDLKAVPNTYDEMRRADAHGLYEIDRKAFSFFSRKGPLDPDFLQLLSHVVLGTVLSKLVPFLYGDKPKLLQLGTAPYGEILAAVQRDAAAAACIAATVIGVVVFKLGSWLLPKATVALRSAMGAA